MFTAAVVGLGNIGQGYDYDLQDASRVLTHASGFHHHPGFRLVAGVDPDPGARERFTQKFRQPAFPSIAELYENLSPEVVSLGVPTAQHLAAFQEVAARGPKAILCEKPLAGTLAEAEKICDLAQKGGILLLVNYLRRFEPGVLELKQRIERRELGEIYKGTLWYSKGILNNGSHFIDLLMFLLGEARQIAWLDGGRPGLEDPEPDLQITFGGTTVYFLAGREECFSSKELELVGTLGTITYGQGGEQIVLRKTRQHPLFPAYRVLEADGQPIATDLAHYQWHVLEALYQALTRGSVISSNGATALETMAVAERIINLGRERGNG